MERRKQAISEIDHRFNVVSSQLKAKETDLDTGDVAVAIKIRDTFP